VILRRPCIALILVAAFLLHDGWMAHTGHIVYASDSAGMAPGPRTSGDSHRHAGMAATGALMPDDAAIPSDLPPQDHPTCSTIRIGAPNPGPGIAPAWTGVAIRPLPTALTEGGVRVTARHAPPGPPPDTRRALLQVYRI